MVAAGQVGASDGAGEEQVPGEEHGRDVRALGHPERHRPLGMARRVRDGRTPDPPELRSAPSASSRTSSGSPTVSSPISGMPDGAAERLLRVAHHVAVLGVDPGRDVVGPAHRDDRGDMVDVAVGEDDRDGLEPMLGERVLDSLGGLVARVDDHALLTRGGGDQVTVGPPGPGGEPGNEHVRPSWWRTRWCRTGRMAVQIRAYRRCRFHSEPIYGTGTRRRSGSQDARVPIDVRDARGEDPVVSKDQRRRQLAREKFLRQQQRRYGRAPQDPTRNAVIASVVGVLVAWRGAVRTRPGSSTATARRPTPAPRRRRAPAPRKAPDPCAKPAAGKVQAAAAGRRSRR